jgi:PHS family inorganic phosphate transporter-like MFS transporter
MLTLVFACQPIGQLAATLVALIAVARQRDGIPSDAFPTQCNTECKKTLDSIWRWIIGVGVIPAVIALWFRLTIIESSRYTADVERDSNKAAAELKNYLLVPPQQVPVLASTSSSSSLDQVEATQENFRMRRRNSGASSGVASDAGSGIASGAASIIEEAHPQQNRENPQGGFVDSHIAITQLPLRNETGLNEQVQNLIPNGNHNVSLWLNQESLAGLEGGKLDHNKLPPAPSWREFKDYFWHAGNLRTLLATAFCWFCKLALIIYCYRLNSRANTSRH